jgi:lipopolysaccharide biosynthesis glycosyltransferase
MIVALATDRNFVELAGVLTRSLCALGNVPEAQIVIFGNDLRQTDKTNLQACADRPVTFIDVQDVMPSLRGVRTTYNWTITAYTRLLAPELIEGSGRMLYLDCDIIINGDLRSLFEVDLGDSNIIAARGNENYFNSGVLLIDLDRWRAEGITQKTVAYAHAQGDALRFVDQDALNAVLVGRFLPLSMHWNLPRKSADAYSTSAIIHFTGKKPDYSDCKNPARVLYLQHRQATPWANKPLKSKWRRRLNRLLYRLKQSRPYAVHRNPGA